MKQLKMMLQLKIIAFLLLFASLSLIISSTEYPSITKDECPPSEAIPKCSCSTKSGGIRITCDQLLTDEELRNTLQGLKGYTLRKLEISEYTASSIPTDLFYGLEIEDLSLVKVEVKDASFRKGKRHFQGLEGSIKTLEIRNSFRVQDRPLLNLQLDHLKNLQEVILEHNVIPEVGDDWFGLGPQKITVVILEGNNIEELGKAAFSALMKLKLLAVAGNHLHTLSRSMFPMPANQLTTLDLANNKIRTLPTDIFTSMPSLQDLNLERNLIHLIKQDTWGLILSQLDALKLDGNVLQCDADLKWICDTRMPSDIHGKCRSPSETKGLSLPQFCKQI